MRERARVEKEHKKPTQKRSIQQAFFHRGGENFSKKAGGEKVGGERK